MWTKFKNKPKIQKTKSKKKNTQAYSVRASLSRPSLPFAWVDFKPNRYLCRLNSVQIESI